jgi:hypothetical protein
VPSHCRTRAGANSVPLGGPHGGHASGFSKGPLDRLNRSASMQGAAASEHPSSSCEYYE